MRVKRGVAAHAKHKKILKAAKGMQHARTRSYRLGKQGVIKALQSATCVHYGLLVSTMLLVS